MNKKLLIAAALALTVSVAGCGNNTNQASTESPSEQAAATLDPTTETGEHDATEKENSIQKDAESASTAEKGSTKKLDGTYNFDGAKNVTYTFANGKMTLTESGKYSMGKGKIILTYGQDPKTEYEITETDAGFNLTHESNLLPLVYMEGTDGLTGSEPFDGVYQIEGAQGFIFHSDGNMEVITTHECEVKDDSVTFADQTYDYRTEGDSIILSTNGTDVIKLVP